MSDIDILVTPKDLKAALAVIETGGYEKQDRQDLDRLLKTKYHVVYRHPDTHVLVEIHWKMTSGHLPALVRPDDADLMARWWSRALPIGSHGDHVYQLHPIDSICLIASHFFKHRFARANAGFSSHGAILQLCDLFNVVHYYDKAIDGDILAAESRRIGLAKTVGVALNVIEMLFADAFDGQATILDAPILETADRSIAQLVIKRIFSMPDRRAPVPIDFIAVNPSVSVRSRIGRIIQAAFPDPDTVARQLDRPTGSNRIYSNYALRMIRLLKKYALTGFKRGHLKEEAALRRWIEGMD